MTRSFSEMAALSDLENEASALEKQINAGMPTHPGEIYDLVKRILFAIEVALIIGASVAGVVGARFINPPDFPN